MILAPLELPEFKGACDYFVIMFYRFLFFVLRVVKLIYFAVNYEREIMEDKIFHSCCVL